MTWTKARLQLATTTQQTASFRETARRRHTSRHSTGTWVRRTMARVYQAWRATAPSPDLQTSQRALMVSASWRQYYGPPVARSKIPRFLPIGMSALTLADGWGIFHLVSGCSGNTSTR